MDPKQDTSSRLQGSCTGSQGKEKEEIFSLFFFSFSLCFFFFCFLLFVLIFKGCFYKTLISYVYIGFFIAYFFTGCVVLFHLVPNLSGLHFTSHTFFSFAKIVIFCYIALS